ncbi:MBL fold metallo-hydrolase [Rhizorhabdus sp.]|uniref:MBL fold metallo-hydrolase n=1 Tax=Rhizorhabdus sp. TaxID=1968843 RepID=UPI001992F930|nr:MBL fold metallo-hydrolase [Rhizorhabdus sp.]MBD3759627.1 MBL fold metallo-hydrolase [Rhizorhabdus sp.]
MAAGSSRPPVGQQGRIGDVGITTIHDCVLHDTAARWFPDYDREMIRPHEHWLSPYHLDAETGAFEMPVHSFLVQTGRHNILVDTCVGNDKDRPMIDEMHGLSTGYLDRLREAGLRPEDIDYVMCTHLHIDHVGWNTRLLDGRWVPTFPNATYIFSRTEYEAARAEANLPDMFPAVRNAFEDSVRPILDAGKVELVDGIHEMLDGFTLRPAPGHSPGHVRIELRSRGETGVFAGDLIHNPVQVPLWQLSTVACWDQEMAAATRRDLLAFCADENALLLPGHFRPPFVGRVRERSGNFTIDFGW